MQEAMAEIIIYQIDISKRPSQSLVFLPYDTLIRSHGLPDMANYAEVYRAKVRHTSDQALLDSIFTLLNAENRPAGDSMRSLSVSDVVVIDGRAYYCDFVGWKRIDWPAGRADAAGSQA